MPALTLLQPFTTPGGRAGWKGNFEGRRVYLYEVPNVCRTLYYADNTGVLVQWASFIWNAGQSAALTPDNRILRLEWAGKSFQLSADQYDASAVVAAGKTDKVNDKVDAVGTPVTAEAEPITYNPFLYVKAASSAPVILPSCYSRLGVPPTATEEEIKSAFRTKAKTAHPDVGGDAEEFKQLKVAYDEALWRLDGDICRQGRKR